MQGVRHDKIGQMVHIDNSDKYKEDPVLQVTPLYFVLGQLQKNDLNLMMRTMKSILFFFLRDFSSLLALTRIILDLEQWTLP